MQSLWQLEMTGVLSKQVLTLTLVKMANTAVYQLGHLTKKRKFSVAN